MLLADAVDRLPDDYREAFVLRTLEHVPFEDIAARMGRSTGAVRMLWARAVKKLNEMLEEAGMNGDVAASRDGNDSGSQDGELARALESYLSAVEAGRPVDPDRLAAEHPAIADELRSCLEVLRLAGRVEAEPGADGPDEGRPVDPDRMLGDFRMIRQVGRGGMGVVYEAEQVSLHRRVALKVLPFASALDPLQLRRFQTEALAAAQLHHTNIVPVFSVGCERGVHYYAMQYIEGQTLAALVRDLRRLEGLDAAAPASASSNTT